MIYLELLWTFFKIGLFTIGGGHAMIPLIMSEVSAHGWIDQQVLIDFIGIAESTPGPFAINIATYTGVERAGVLGAVCATLGVVLGTLRNGRAVRRRVVYVRPHRTRTFRRNNGAGVRENQRKTHPTHTSHRYIRSCGSSAVRFHSRIVFCSPFVVLFIWHGTCCA